MLVAGGAGAIALTVLVPTSETFYCTYVAGAEIYDPATDSWTAAGVLANPRRYGHAATALASGKVLVTGGRDNNGAIASAGVYDPGTNS